jgi:hypothetical protein
MKTIFKYIICLAVGMTVTGPLLTSCSDQLEEEFYNPDKITQPDFQLFFASTLTQGHLFRYDYGATYHYMRGFGKMLGLGVSPLYIDPVQNTAIVKPWDGWSGQPFNEFVFDKTNVNYSKDINAMKLLYAGMSDEEKTENKAYILCSDIVLCYAFQRSTDLYDDIPYFEVGGAFQEKFYAKYDAQKEIYKDILSRLKEAAAGLEGINFSTDAAKIKFKSADLLCSGNIDLWIRMANSLRLRMAMRLCHVEESTSISTIKELVAENRMLTEYAHNIGFEEQDKTHAFEVTFFRGLDERGFESGAPQTMIEDIINYHVGDELLQGEEGHHFDPRLYAIFQPDIHGRYIGVPLTLKVEGSPCDSYLKKYYTKEEISNMVSFEDYNANPWEVTRICAMYNRKTYFNFDMKFPVMHSTETNLLLAEAALRWPGEFGNINAQECIKKAIDSSTRFYYATNANNIYSPASTPSLQHLKESATAPTIGSIEQHLSDYKTYAANRYAALPTTKDKLKFLFDQKFLDMNIMNPYEIYNEARRLVKDFDGELPFLPTPNVVFQERMYYPASESSNNPDNFKAVAAKNNHFTPVWWTGRTTTATNKNGNVFQ